MQAESEAWPPVCVAAGVELRVSSCTSTWGSCNQTSSAARMDMTFVSNGSFKTKKEAEIYVSFSTE